MVTSTHPYPQFPLGQLSSYRPVPPVTCKLQFRVSDCQAVNLGVDIRNPGNLLTTVVLERIGTLQLQSRALDFDHPTNLVLAEIGGIAGDHPPYFWANIHTLVLRSTTLLGLRPAMVAQDFSPDSLAILNATLAVYEALGETENFLFDLKNPMSQLRIENCTVNTTDKISFIRGRALKIDIIGNVLNIAGSGGHINLTGNQVRLVGNMIHAREARAIMIQANQDLLVQANKLSNKNSDVLDFVFPEREVRSISFINSNLYRVKKHFIKATAEVLTIKNCTLELGSENCIVGEFSSFMLSECFINRINTGALSIKEVASTNIVQNTFKNSQLKAFYNFHPTEKAIAEMANNTFLSFDHGFLKLSAGLETKLHLSKVKLPKPCHCLLAQDAITEGEETFGNLGLKMKQEEKGKFEVLLELAILCYNTSSMSLVPLRGFLTTSSSCHPPTTTTSTTLGVPWEEPVWYIIGPSYFPSLHSNMSRSLSSSLPAKEEADLTWVVCLVTGLLLATSIAAVATFRAGKLDESKSQEMQESICADE